MQIGYGGVGTGGGTKIGKMWIGREIVGMEKRGEMRGLVCWRL
jgi:hypothetical protein